MPKYKVLQRFRDKYTKEEYEKDDIIELTEERANEAIENLKGYDGEFLEFVEGKKTEKVEVDGIDVEEMTVPQLKSALNQMGVKYKSNDTKEALISLLESETEKEGD